MKLSLVLASLLFATTACANAQEIKPPLQSEPVKPVKECKLPIDVQNVDKMPAFSIRGFAIIDDVGAPTEASQFVFHDADRILVLTFLIQPNGDGVVGTIIDRHRVSGGWTTATYADSGYFTSTLAVRSHPGTPCEWKSIGPAS